MVHHLRVFAIGGLISYRALFNWAKPAIYIPTMLGSTLFQILFFAYVGRNAQLRDDAYFVVGNAVQISAMAGIYGMAMAIGGERFQGTLSPLLVTPANRLPLFLGRMVPQIANGLIVSAFGFVMSRLLLDFHPPLSSVPALALVVLVSATSCTCFGACFGAIGLRVRDVFVGANVVYFLMLLLCGVNVPLETLPGWLQAIGRGLPLTHGIEAARAVAEGASLSAVSGPLGTEALIGAVYAAAGFGLFRLFEIEGRRRATLEIL
jgi:ABC-2 type transport system permease protein